MASGFRLVRRMALLSALAPLGCVGGMATTAQAHENYALIVADSDYPNLDQKYWLKGPKNDEILVRDYLLDSAPVKFAPQNVVALGSGDGLQLGTHKNILDALARIAAEAKAGDFVYLHFSGHGSQQPATRDSTEADGRDEVFLSADTEMASFLCDLLERQASDDVINLPMQRADIADYLGLTFETVSRVLRVLKDKGIIRVTSVDRIDVIDADALRSLTE